MTKKKIEQRLARRVKELGGILVSFTHPDRRGGWPSLIMVFPGVTVWIRTADSGSMPSSLQAHRIMSLRNFGVMVSYCDSEEKADEIAEAAFRLSQRQQKKNSSILPWSLEG